MGTWGPGNFDDDTAADHLSIVTSKLVEEIEQAFAAAPRGIEPDEYGGVAVPCNVELLALIGEQRWVGVQLPSVATAAKWKQQYLAVWDGYIAALTPKPAHTIARRAAIVSTFDRLAALCAREQGKAPSTTKTKAKPKAKPKKPTRRTS